MEVYEIKSTTSSLFGSKSKVKAKGGGRLQTVKSVTLPGKCSAISDGDWTVFPKINYAFSLAFTTSPDGIPQPHAIPNDDDNEMDEVKWFTPAHVHQN